LTASNRSRIAASGLAVLATAGLAWFPGFHEETGESGSEIEIKPFPSRMACHRVYAALLISSMLMLVSIIWQHTAAVAATTMVKQLGGLETDIGVITMILGWAAVVLLFLATIMLDIMIRSLSLLDELADVGDFEDGNGEIYISFRARTL
jgi:hypothetical protein